jgi:phage terminase small subunit
MQKDAIEQMRKIAVEFGMSVSSRSRMTLPSEKDVDDDMERLLSGG